MDDNENGATDGPVETIEAGPADAETAGDLPTNEQGFPLVGGYPLNSRLRSEALALAGETTDPDGIVSDGHIAATGAQLAAVAQHEAREKEAPAITSRTTLRKLLEIAEAEGVQIGDDDRDDRAAVSAAITAHRAANTEA